MRRALFLILSIAPLFACSPNEPPKTVDPSGSTTASPTASSAPPIASASAAPTTTASAAPIASASAAPTSTASAPTAVAAFHAIPLGQSADLAIPVAGKVTYLQFCASWCVPCTKLLPIAQQFSAKYKDQGLVVVAVEEDEAKADVLPFAKKLGVTFPVIWDDGAKFGALWKVATMPTGYVIGRSGAIAYTQRGYSQGDEAALEKAITTALAEKIK